MVKWAASERTCITPGMEQRCCYQAISPPTKTIAWLQCSVAASVQVRDTGGGKFQVFFWNLSPNLSGLSKALWIRCQMQRLTGDLSGM